jgi:hypothetical protein
MSIVGKRILFKNKKVSTPTWGTVLDKVITSNFQKGSSQTKYLVQSIVTLKQSENKTSDETIFILVNPKHIEVIE